MQAEVAAHRNIERNIVKEIMRECFPKKIYPKENFVAYFIKLLLLDPNWGITDDFVTSRENVAKFVAYVIKELECTNNPKLVTLQMQFYFNCNIENMGNIVRRNRKNLLDRLVRLKNEIFRMTDTESPEEIDNLMRLIVYYITLVSGMGNPLENEVYEETFAVFRSVVNEEELKEFMGFNVIDKEIDITQLMKVVSGIRLFNKDSELGGAGMLDLPDLLEKAVASVKEEVHTHLINVMEKVNLLTTVVDKSYVIEKVGKEGVYIMVYKARTENEEFDIEHIKDTLIFYRQCELFIRKIMEKLQNLEIISKEIYGEFRTTMKEIYQIVNVKIAIQARIVFPLFEALSDRWTDLQNEVVILTRYSKIVTNLIEFSKNVQFNKELLESVLGEEGVLSDADRLEETSHLRIRSVDPEVEVTDLMDFPNIDNITLQYLGFCSWKLVQTEGGLIPGNPSMGVATFEKKNFVLSVPQACLEFSKLPHELVNEVLALGRKKPQLINFLDIKEDLELVTDIIELAKEKDYVKHTDDKNVQTRYQSRPFIDKTYSWNIWDYKRQALQLADLSKRKTKSTQTSKTYFRNTLRIQTYEKREKIVQTKKDNYTNVPKPSAFIFGLRGRKDDKQFIINLTRPVTDYC